MQCSTSGNASHYRIPQNAHFARITPQIWGIANPANPLKCSCFLSISPLFYFFSRPYLVHCTVSLELLKIILKGYHLVHCPLHVYQGKRK